MSELGLELELELGALEEVAITRNVVRSKRITSVALHASAKVVRCFESTVAFGMRVWTMLDHAWRGRVNARYGAEYKRDNSPGTNSRHRC